MNVVPFRLKQKIGRLSDGHGMLYYDREFEAIRIAEDYDGDEAQLIAEFESTIDLPQKEISRIHFQKALFGGGSIVIRLRGGESNQWHRYFGVAELEFPIAKNHQEQADELITEVKFDLFEDSLDEMLDFTDEALGYKKDDD